jgi:hypothetical protein
MMRGHLERWLELILASSPFVLLPAFAMAALPLAIPALTGTPSLMLFWLIVVGAWPIVQYAWTFFYLRLVEIRVPVDESAAADHPAASPSLPAAAAAAGSPRLRPGPTPP